MGRAKQLTDYEKGQIDGLRNSGSSIREIAESINRSADVVHHYLTLGENYGAAKSPGRPKKVSERDRWHVLRLVSNEKLTSAEISHQTKLQVSRRTILNVIHESQCFQWTTKDKKPNLKPEHKLARLNFACDHMSWDNQWISIILM